MDGITRKRMQCDSHIAKIGYFGWKKIGKALGKGKGLSFGRGQKKSYVVIVLDQKMIIYGTSV